MPTTSGTSPNQDDRTARRRLLRPRPTSARNELVWGVKPFASDGGHRRFPIPPGSQRCDQQQQRRRQRHRRRRSTPAEVRPAISAIAAAFVVSLGAAAAATFSTAFCSAPTTSARGTAGAGTDACGRRSRSPCSPATKPRTFHSSRRPSSASRDSAVRLDAFTATSSGCCCSCCCRGGAAAKFTSWRDRRRLNQAAGRNYCKSALLMGASSSLQEYRGSEGDKTARNRSSSSSGRNTRGSRTGTGTGIGVTTRLGDGGAGRSGGKGPALTAAAVEQTEELTGSTVEEIFVPIDWEGRIVAGGRGAAGARRGRGAVGLGANDETGSQATAALTEVGMDASVMEEVQRRDMTPGRSSGGPRSTSMLRRSCGDPAFFEDLKATFSYKSKKFLTHEEEMELGTKVQRYRRLQEEYELLEKTIGPPAAKLDVSATAGLTEEEYGSIMVEGMRARQQLVVSNLALVVSLANKYKRNNHACNCLQTLIQEGTVGLIRAAERYDPTKGFRFTTYAIWWIEAKLRVSVQTEDEIIHVPLWVKNKYRVVSRSLPHLRESLGREPTATELSDQVLIDTDSKVQVSPKKISQLSQWAGVQRRHLSLDMGVKVYRDGGEGAFAHEKSLLAKEPSQEVTSDCEIQRRFLESCMGPNLTDVQQQILRMRAGLNGKGRRSRKEVSKTLNIPVEKVIGEERKAYYKLGNVRGRWPVQFADFK